MRWIRLNGCFKSQSIALWTALKSAAATHRPAPRTNRLTPAEGALRALAGPAPAGRPSPWLRPLPILPGSPIACRDHRFTQAVVSISAPIGDPIQTMADKSQKRWVCCLRKAYSQLSAEVETFPGDEWSGLR